MLKTEQPEDNRDVMSEPINEKLATMLRAYPDTIFRIRKDGLIIDFHAPIGRLILPPEKLYHANIRDVLKAEQVDECMEHIRLALENDDIVRTFYHDIVHQGRSHYFEGRIVKNREDEVLMVARDITSRKKAELLNDVLYQIAIKSSERVISIREFCHEIELQVKRLINLSEFYISRVDRPNTLTFIHMSNEDTGNQAPFTRKNGAGLSEHIIETGKPLLLRSEQLVEFQNNRRIKIYGKPAKCWIGAPITSGKNTIGVIACQSYINPEQFDESDLELLTAIGSQIGLWIDRQRMHEQQVSLLEIFNRSLNEIYIFDSETFQFDYVNLGACKNLGYTLEEMKTLTPIDLKKEFNEKSFKELISPLKAGNLSTLRFEAVHERKDGTTYPVEVHLQNSDFKGKPSFVAIILDITHRKTIENSIKDREAQFRSLAENAPNVIARINRKYEIEYINKGLFGLTQEDIIGKSVFDMIDPKNTKLVKDNLDHTFSTGQGSTYKNSREFKNAPTMYLETYVGPVHTSDENRINSVVAIISDISERHLSEEALRKSETEFRSLADNAPNFILKINKDYIVEYINRVETIKSREDAIGRPIFDFLDEHDHVHVRKTLKKVLNEGIQASFITSTVRENGQSAIYKTNAGPITNDAGEVNSAILIIQDITEQTLANQALESSYYELSLIDRINQASIEGKTLDDLINLTMSSTTELGPINGGRMYLYEPETKSLILKNESLENRTLKKIEQKIGIKLKAVIPPLAPGSLFHKAITNQSIIVINDHDEIVRIVGEHTANPYVRKFSGWAVKLLKIKTFLLVPLVTKQRVFGLITLYSKTMLNVEDIRRVKRFANEITASLAKTMAEQETQNQKRFIEDVLNNLPADIAVYNDSHKYMFVNPGAIPDEEMRSWIVGKDDFDYCRQKGMDDTLANARSIRFKQARKTGSETVWVDTQGTGKEEKHVMRKFYPVYEGKHLKYMLEYGVDITDRVEAEKVKEEFTRRLEEKVLERTAELEISQNESKYQLDTLNEIALVSMTDIEGNITYANDIFCRVSGYTREELIGQNHRILKSEKQSESIFKGMWKAISLGHIWKGEIINKAKDGSHYWVNTTIVPFFDVHGNIEKYVSVRFNITEQKEWEDRLRKSLQKEKELGKLKSQFVATASHQFRTPMAIIQSNSELMTMITENSDGELKQKLERVTQRIKTEVKRMTNLMDEILTLGRISAGKLQIHRQSTCVLELCLELIDKYDNIQKDGRAVDFIHEGDPYNLKIDPVLISHSISNLLSNAFKYSKGKNPRLDLHYDEDGVVLKVIDFGIGIPEKDLENLFLPFHRANNVGEIPGTGLGLAIVLDYVRLNGGDVAVTSKTNEGSTFTVRLPKSKKT